MKRKYQITTHTGQTSSGGHNVQSIPRPYDPNAKPQVPIWWTVTRLLSILCLGVGGFFLPPVGLCVCVLIAAVIVATFGMGC